MGAERTQAEIDRQAEELLGRIAKKAPVLRGGEEIIIFPEVPSEAESSGDHEGGESVSYSLSLTPNGLIERRNAATYKGDLNESQGKPEREDNREYPVTPSDVLGKHYILNEAGIGRLEHILHWIESQLNR
jgi:hypothetical protein